MCGLPFSSSMNSKYQLNNIIDTSNALSFHEACSGLQPEANTRFSFTREVCWFVTVQIEKYPVTLLFDTGAGRTMIDRETLSAIKLINPEINVKISRIKLLTASGDLMPVDGVFTGTIVIGVYVVEHNLVVANIDGVNGVLGMDLIDRLGSPVELAGGILSLSQGLIYLHRETKATGLYNCC